jgi:hypothetical protein
MKNHTTRRNARLTATLLAGLTLTAGVALTSAGPATAAPVDSATWTKTIADASARNPILTGKKTYTFQISQTTAGKTSTGSGVINPDGSGETTVVIEGTTLNTRCTTPTTCWQKAGDNPWKAGGSINLGFKPFTQEDAAKFTPNGPNPTYDITGKTYTVKGTEDNQPRTVTVLLTKKKVVVKQVTGTDNTLAMTLTATNPVKIQAPQ